MKRESYELPSETEHFARRFPFLRGVRCWRVMESTFFGWVGCKLCRITWAENQVETRVITAETFEACAAEIQMMMEQYGKHYGYIVACY